MNLLSMEFEIPLVSFIFLLFLIIIFYSKKRIDLIENKTYEVILITSFITSGCDFVVHLLSALTEYNQLITKYYFLVDLLNKIISTSFVMIFTSLSCYVLLISYKKLRENSKILWNIIVAVPVIFLLLVSFTNVTVTEAEFARNTIGIPIILSYIIVGINIVFSMILSIKNFNKNDKRYYTIFLIAMMMAVLFIISVLFRGIIIYDLVLALLCYIMYFTLENPDLQTINMLIRNKELVEESVNDKSNFLFKLSQEMRMPLKNIISNIKVYRNAKNMEERNYIIDLIDKEVNNAYFIINDITSISSADVKKIKMQDNKYKTEKLFKELEVNIKNKLSIENKTDNIEFNFKILNNYPEYLCGDNIKLKQILLSLISNSIKYTEKGFIDFEVDIISRYDVSRLIFTIKDSGKGMTLSKVNELLSSNVDIDTIDFQKDDNLELNIPIIIKIIKLLGGSINIKSEEGQGTVIIIVIDQKISATTGEEHIEKTKKYSTIAKKSKKIIIADDTENLEKVRKLLSKHDVELYTTLNGKDIVDKIKSGDTCDLIILKDEMKPDNAYTILKELQEINKFNIPVAIIIKQEKDFIKHHYVKDGFSDCIVLENIETEIEKIYEKYI